MQDIIQDFIDDMTQNGLAPYRTSDIRGDDTRKNYRSKDDDKGKKTCFYKLKIEGDFAFGYYGSYVTDQHFSYTSKSSKIYSKTEIEAFRKKAEEEKKQEIENRKKLQEQKADSVQNFLFFLEPAQSHPYLKEKQIADPCGALHSGDNLIIPMYDINRTWNYQRIDAEGNKEYFAEAKKTGTYFEIEGDESTIYLCEGYATGCSINMATGNKVIVCFDCGNIDPVYKTLIGLAPSANFVLAADNDHEKTRAGVKKAEYLKSVYGLPYVYPVFKDGAGKTDFNDLYISEGIKETESQLRKQKSETANEVQEVQEETPSAVDNSWRENLITNKNGLVPTSTINAHLILENDENLKGLYMFDDFSKNILIMRCPPWDNQATFKVRPIQDYDYIPLECYLEKEWGIRANKNKCADIIQAIAMKEENTFNPASDYFKALKWDGVKRLDNWLIDYVTDGSQNQDYLRIVGSKFLCGLAARAMYAGIKFDTMIIFEGKQYAGKSSLARIMATVGNEEYFLDDFKDIENKDALMKMQGKLIVEFPEISTMRKAEVNDLKAFITRQSDEFRPPYGRNIVVSPRQCVFVGTVNPEGAYFKDMTGNRRYWPVSCRDRLNLAGLKEVMPQLHAEAAHRVREGELLYLMEDEFLIAQAEQEKRCMFDLWQDKVEAAVRGLSRITTDDLCSTLGIETEKRNNMVFTRLQQIMANIGFKPARIREAGAQKRGFMRIENVPQQNEEEISW